MTCPQPATDYAVVVTKLEHGYDLRIRELLVNVRALDLAEGWRLVQQRKQEVIDCALSAGLAEELPPPLSPPTA